jgi:hypothetical protein
MTMPKGEIYKIPVNKEIFMSIVKECGSSIIKLGECKDVECTERTIRRSLKEERITPRFLEQIAKHLNVDSRLLSGELHVRANVYCDDFLRSVYLAQVKVKNYPYFKKRKSDLDEQPIEALLEQILALFDISFSQFEDMDFESRYRLQHDLLEALVPVIRNHFKVNAFGEKDMPNLEKIICDLENYRNDYYLHIYAEEVLRKKFLEYPPYGRSKSEIRKMDAEELIALDMHDGRK